MNIVAEIASELLGDEDLMRDTEMHTCNIIVERVFASNEISYVKYRAGGYIRDLGTRFIARVVQDPQPTLGYELSEGSVEMINFSRSGGSPFVHLLSYGDDGKRDMERFELCRRAWLKFLVDNGNRWIGE